MNQDKKNEHEITVALKNKKDDNVIKLLIHQFLQHTNINDAITKNGRTLLMVAVELNRDIVVDLLIKAHANVMQMYNRG